MRNPVAAVALLDRDVSMTVFSPIVASTILAGLAAGFFFAYSANVVWALDRLSGSTYTEVMQPINATVRNPAFAAVFFGAIAVSALGAVVILVRGDGLTPYGVLFLSGAIVYVLGTFAVTVMIHVPMNESIATWSATAPPADWAAVRARWALWNHVRTIAATISFVLYLTATVALVAGR